MKSLFVLVSLVSLFSLSNAYACKTETASGLAAIESVVGGYKYDNYVNKLDSQYGLCNKLAENHYNIYKKLKKEEVMGIYSYTTNDIYRKLNSVLRKGSKATAADKKKYKPIVKIINSGLSKLPKYKGKVVRFEKKKSVSRFISAMKKGTPKLFKAYTSSSKKKKFCWSGNVKMVITSKNGRYIAPMSAYKSEEEVLFAPGTKFKITKVKKVKKNADGSIPNASCHNEDTLNVIHMTEVTSK